MLIVKKLFLSFKPSDLCSLFWCWARSLQFTYFLCQPGSPLGSANSGRSETEIREKGFAPSCSLPFSISVTQATVLHASSSGWFQLWTSFHIPRRRLITFLRDTSTSQPANLLSGLSPDRPRDSGPSSEPLRYQYKVSTRQHVLLRVWIPPLRPFLQVLGPNNPNLDLLFLHLLLAVTTFSVSLSLFNSPTPVIALITLCVNFLR